jgi:hypothetical protein
MQRFISQTKSGSLENLERNFSIQQNIGNKDSDSVLAACIVGIMMQMKARTSSTVHASTT